MQTNLSSRTLLSQAYLTEKSLIHQHRCYDVVTVTLLLLFVVTNNLLYDWIYIDIKAIINKIDV